MRIFSMRVVINNMNKKRDNIYLQLNNAARVRAMTSAAASDAPTATPTTSPSTSHVDP